MISIVLIEYGGCCVLLLIGLFYVFLNFFVVRVPFFFQRNLFVWFLTKDYFGLKNERQNLPNI
jgi:hypothetical protein